MAKIVGKDPKHVKTVSCDECASIIEFTMSETERKGFSDWTGDTDYYQCLTCPECGNLLKVSRA